MQFEQTVRDIRKVFSIVSDGKDADVHLTFKGTSHGVSKPWHIKIDSRELNHETHDGAAEELLLKLKKELADKISSLEKMASDYRRSLGSFDN